MRVRSCGLSASEITCHSFRFVSVLKQADAHHRCPEWVCAVIRRRFPVVQAPPGDSLQPEATGAGMEETKCLKPSDSGSRNTVTARVCRPQREWTPSKPRKRRCAGRPGDPSGEG